MRYYYVENNFNNFSNDQSLFPIVIIITQQFLYFLFLKKDLYLFQKII